MIPRYSRPEMAHLWEPEAKFRELLGRQPGERVAGSHGSLGGHRGDVLRDPAPGQERQREQNTNAHHRGAAGSRTMISPRM